MNKKTFKLSKFLKNDYNKRSNIYREEKNYLKTKILTRNKILPLSKRINFNNELKEFTRYTHLRNRCLISNRSRGIKRKLGISRIEWLKETSIGNIPGITSQE